MLNKMITARIENLKKVTPRNLIFQGDAYKDILDLQDVDPDAVSKFMTSPIELNTTTFYEVED